jgi:hypothetical protein
MFRKTSKTITRIADPRRLAPLDFPKEAGTRRISAGTQGKPQWAMAWRISNRSRRERVVGNHAGRELMRIDRQPVEEKRIE